jgi:sugar phosphate isomerase/epimerase
MADQRWIKIPKMNANMKPKLALCNFLADVTELRELAFRHGFSGIDWSFDATVLPATPLEESKWMKNLSAFDSLEVRYHCPFYQIDLGHQDPAEAKAAEAIFRRIIRLVSKVEGKYLTIHIGLGHDSTEPLSWEATIENLTRLVQYGARKGVTLCLENLAWGWTSRPHLFEKLIRGSGASVTFDIGHAHACESVRSHSYSAEDFVAPHSDRVLNAHIYHKEVSNQGHMPPDRLEDIQDRLAILEDIGCMWWVLEVREENGLLQTQRIVNEYLTQSKRYNRFDHQDRAASLTSHG